MIESFLLILFSSVAAITLLAAAIETDLNQYENHD